MAAEGAVINAEIEQIEAKMVPAFRKVSKYFNLLSSDGTMTTNNYNAWQAAHNDARELQKQHDDKFKELHDLVKRHYIAD